MVFALYGCKDELNIPGLDAFTPEDDETVIRKLTLNTLGAETERNRKYALDELIGPKRKAAIGLLTKWAAADDAAIREAAIYVLGEMKDLEYAPTIVKALEDPSPEVRFRAVNALGTLNPPGLFELLEKTFQRSGDDAQVQKATLRAIGRLHDDMSIIFLRKLTGDEKSPHRAFAVELLGELNDRDSIDAIFPLVKSTDPDLRDSALYALARMKAYKAVPDLIGELTNKDPDYVYFVTETLQKITGEKSIDKPNDWREWLKQNKAKLEQLEKEASTPTSK
jgi:HEAT repeat protein